MFIAVLFGTCMTYDVTKNSSTILKVFDYHDEQIWLYIWQETFFITIKWHSKEHSLKQLKHK